MADGFLRTCEPGTCRTYSYLLVDHLRWLVFECLAPDTVALRDLQRYMAALGAEYAGPHGQPWRVGKAPYGQSGLGTMAACLKRFYAYQSAHGINQALAKDLDGSRLPTKADRRRADGVICGGAVRRASPAMISSYFRYITSEYPPDAGHGMLLVQLRGPNRGQPLATQAVRGMLRRSAARLELGRIRPHQFRHSFATGVLDASGGNTIYARDAGGWASAATVDEIYGHADVHDPAFAAALNRFWGE